MSTFHARTRELLARAGLEARELEALDHPARHAVPARPGGFGLVGTNGTGKTWALTHYVAGLVEAAVRSQPDPWRASLCWIDGLIARDRRLLWVNWHDQAERIHERRFEPVWLNQWAEWAEDVPLLVLDDLGRERTSGEKDPARPLLARVLDARHRRKFPVLWTSNLVTPEALEAFYDPALKSRILGSWPASYVGGQDMRLSPLDLKAAAGGEA